MPEARDRWFAGEPEHSESSGYQPIVPNAEELDRIAASDTRTAEYVEGRARAGLEDAWQLFFASAVDNDLWEGVLQDPSRRQEILDAMALLRAEGYADAMRDLSAEADSEQEQQ